MTKDELKLYQTSISTDDKGKVSVTYYKTAIVTFDDETIVLNSGGWWTRTTLVRMNQVSRHFNLGYRVFIKDTQWYVEFKEEKCPFDIKQIRLDRKTESITLHT